MYVPDDETVTEGLYSIAEDVSADRLADVPHELWIVGLDAFLFLHGADVFVGDGLLTAFVFTDAGVYIAEITV